MFNTHFINTHVNNSTSAHAGGAHRIDRGGYGYVRPLEDEDIARIAPSVFAEDAHSSRSQRYAYIPQWGRRSACSNN